MPNTPHQPVQHDPPTPIAETEPVNLANPPQPDPNVNPHPPRRSTRSSRAPTYLQDYQCQVTHPIQKYPTYDRLTKPYRDYVLQVPNIFEPQFYH